MAGKLKNAIVDLYWAKQELKEAREKEMRLRKEVANLMLGKEQKPIYDCQTHGEFVVSAERKVILKIKDKEKLFQFVDDETIPDVVILDPKVTLTRLQDYPENHEIWKHLYLEVSPTPDVSIEVVEK